MNKRIIIILICLQTLIVSAQTNKTEVLILGTAHLHQVEGFKQEMLHKVIQKLDTMHFNVVCVEKMPGQLLYDIKNRNDNSFDEVISGGWGKTYLHLADIVQKEFNISFLEAEKNIETILEKENLSGNDRKELLYNYLAATDLPSAALQYQFIRNTSELFDSDFDKYLTEVLEKRISTNNEIYSLAGPLAYHQNINKIEAIDNFQDEALLLKYFPGFIQDYQDHSEELNKILEQPVFTKIQELTREGIVSGDFSKLYAFLNSEEFMRQDFNAQWKIWLKTNFPSGSDRARYSLWEMRNLQISANILHVISRHPGEKILVIIGSSHKGFLEKYLKQIEDIQLLKYI